MTALAPPLSTSQFLRLTRDERKAWTGRGGLVNLHLLEDLGGSTCTNVSRVSRIASATYLASCDGSAGSTRW